MVLDDQVVLEYQVVLKGQVAPEDQMVSKDQVLLDLILKKSSHFPGLHLPLLSVLCESLRKPLNLSSSLPPLCILLITEQSPFVSH